MWNKFTIHHLGGLLDIKRTFIRTQNKIIHFKTCINQNAAKRDTMTIAIIFKYGSKKITHQDHRYIFNSNKQKKKNRSIFFDKTFKKFQKQIENTALIVNHNRFELVTAYRIQSKIWRN